MPDYDGRTEIGTPQFRVGDMTGCRFRQKRAWTGSDIIVRFPVQSLIRVSRAARSAMVDYHSADKPLEFRWFTVVPLPAAGYPVRTGVDWIGFRVPTSDSVRDSDVPDG